MNRPHLSAEQVSEIRCRHAVGYSVSELAKAFGRSRLAISRIVKGSTYKRVGRRCSRRVRATPDEAGRRRGASRGANPGAGESGDVRQAPAPAPTTIFHLGNVEEGPRCGGAVAGRRSEYGATIQVLTELYHRGCEVCPRCLKLGRQDFQDKFPPGPGGVF